MGPFVSIQYNQKQERHLPNPLSAFHIYSTSAFVQSGGGGDIHNARQQTIGKCNDMIITKGSHAHNSNVLLTLSMKIRLEEYSGRTLVITLQV